MCGHLQFYYLIPLAVSVTLCLAGMFVFKGCEPLCLSLKRVNPTSQLTRSSPLPPPP